MSVKSKPCAHIGARHMAVGAMALIAGAAYAAEQTPAASRGGLLVLPNVRVEAASPAQIRALQAERASVASAGMRAFKDRDTGLLREPTPDERAAIAAEPQALQGPVTVRTLANGTKIAMPGESAMSFSVVRRGDDGRLHDACVTGHEAMTKALVSKADVVHARGHDHDHK